MLKRMIMIVVIISLLFPNLASGNLVKITSKNHLEGDQFDEYVYIEGINNKDLHSFIGISFTLKNFTEEFNKNISLTVIPAKQHPHLEYGDIRIINVSFCQGNTNRAKYRITLECNKNTKEITNDYVYWEHNTTDGFGNYTLQRWHYLLSPEEFEEGRKYAFYIEYYVEDFVVEKDDGEYVYIDNDDLDNAIDKTIILPKKATLKTIPEGSLPLILSDKRWRISVNKASRDGGWYFLTYEILPFYKTGWWIVSVAIISFLLGGILLFLINNYTLKKDKTDIITKIRNSLKYYSQEKRN